MTRRLAIFVAVLTLVSASYGIARPVAASTRAVDPTIAGATDPPHDTVQDNAPPVAVDDPAIPACFDASFGGSFPVPEDWHQFAFLGECGATTNDIDSDGTIVSWQVDTPPAHGVIEWLPDHPEVFGYTPDPNWSTLPGNVPGGNWVSDSFTYHVVDNQGASSNDATYRFWIAPINDAPTFNAGPATVIVHGSAPYNAAWATAVSPGPNEATQSVHFEVTNINLWGTAGLFSVGPSIAPDGTLSFTPAPGKVGIATVTADAKDDGGLEHYSGVPFTADDTSDPVTFDIVVQANGSPVAVDDAPPSIAEDSGSTTIDVLANDTDIEGDTLTITAKTNGIKGTVEISSDNLSVTYQPNANAYGSDSFTYSIDDGHGGTDTATANVTITGSPDPPNAIDDAPPAIAEDAGATPIDVLANDTDPDLDTLTITTKTNGTLGAVEIIGGGTGLSYTPTANVSGSDSFTYTIDDGHGGDDTATVNITINAVNDPPVAFADVVTVAEDQLAPTTVNVLANDTDVEGDTLTVTSKSNGTKGMVEIAPDNLSVTYQPNANAFGSDSFTYTVGDSHGGTDTATVEVTVDAINDPPVAVTDAVTVAEDEPAAMTIDVLANDTDVEGDRRTVTDKTNGAKGIVAIAADHGSVTYKPNANAYGSDSFTYMVSDGNGGTSIGTVNVTITPINDPPNAVNDGVPTPFKVYLKAGAKAIPVLANDTSLPDGPETLRIIVVTQGKHGTVTITGAGTGLTYNPTGTTTGIDVFTYTITDGHGKTDRASVQVTVARDLTLPKATITGLTKSTITGSTKLRLTLAWTLTDTGSGLRSQLLQRRTDSGSWVTVTLPSLSTRTAAFAMSRGHAYTFRVRGTDRSGNVGLFVYRSIRI